MRPMVLNYAGLRRRSRDSHIEGLQRSETLHSMGSRKSDKSHSYRSEALPRSKTFNLAGQPTFDNSHSYKTEGLHRSKTLQNEDLMRSKTFHYENLQTSDELHSQSFNDLTHPPFEGTRGINSVLQNSLQMLIQMLMVLKIAAKYRHVVVLMVFLTRAACTDFQVPISCTSGAVITSPNYPAKYSQFENIDWYFTAPEGRMILLTFNTFSLGSLGAVNVIDTVNDVRKVQRYSGEENTYTPFVSQRNRLLLKFISNGNPTGNGFNISASCYDLSGTRVGRFVGGNTAAKGFLELQAESGGEWMRVCEEHSADRVAEVVCGELGFPGVKEVSYEHGGSSPEGADPDCIRAPSCGNYAYRSQDCSASSEKCNSSLAVKVKCFEPGFKGCYDLGNTQLQNGSPYDSTSQCVTTCRSDTSQAIAIINGSECFCSTTDDIGLSSFSTMEALSCALHHNQLFYNASVGFCNQMDDVMNGSWDFDIAWFGSIVHLTCDEGYRLNGNGTLQCVTAISTHIHVWNGSIPTCEMKADSTSRPFAEPTTTQATSGRDIAISSSTSALLICLICAVVWTCMRRKIHKQSEAPSPTAARESDHTNLPRPLPQTPNDESQPTILLNGSQHVTRMPQNLNTSSTLLLSLELTALHHENNDYASGNPYHYAISRTHPPQSIPNTGNHVNAYELEDMTDQNTIDAEHRTEMMSNRPLPHRPISFGVQEGPSLPPRERHVIHSSTRSPNLIQNTSSNNSHLGASSLNYNLLTNEEQGVTVDRMARNGASTKEVIVIYPFKGTTSKESAHHGYYSANDFEHDEVHNGCDFSLSPSKLDPFYHCLEDDDQQMRSDHCDTDVLINTESNDHDDNLAVVMVDNVLYNPMDF